MSGLWLSACAGDAVPPASAGSSFDTLANGSVLVTNPAEGLWDANPAERWRVVEGLRIGTASGEGDTLLTIRRHYEPAAIPDSVRAAALEPLER